jgi:HD-GYP domain-containing protein (c-di-GMP phosphodiesterase class II)
MHIYKLDYPVYTLDNTQILPAGSVLTPETLDEVIASHFTGPTEKRALLSHGSIRKDLDHLTNLLPYRIVFGDRERVTAVLEFLDHIQLPVSLFDMLDYFRERDFYTYRHILLVFALSTLLAMEMLEDPTDLMQEVIAGPVHDFGKICTPLSILKKATPLTQAERAELEHHTLSGYVLVALCFGDKDIPAAKIARDHHEKRNGSGYPAGTCITSKMTEIVIASDIFDALVSPRPYRPNSYDNRTALEVITVMAEKGELSWEVVQAIVGSNRQTHVNYGDCAVSLDKRGIPPAANTYGKRVA